MRTALAISLPVSDCAWDLTGANIRPRWSHRIKASAGAGFWTWAPNR
jgi:hypothetical protein